jgi:replicative DNA helicase
MNAHFTPDARLMDGITEDDIFAAEEGILASILNKNELLGQCGLEPSDFSEELHRTIFASIQQLCAGHQIADASTIKPFMPRVWQGLDISPAEYLNRLQKAGFYTIQQDHEGRLQLVKGAAMSRQLAREAEFIAALAKEGHSLLTLGDEIEGVEKRLKELQGRFSETRAIKAPGSSYLAAFQASSKRDGVIGVPIALPEIAKVLSEPVFEAGNLYGLLSSSGEGKTSLTVQLILHAIKEGHPVLFFSYDESSVQIIRRMIAMEYGIEMRQQRDPMRMMSERERDQCVAFASWIDQQFFEVIRCQREGIEQLIAYARRFVKKVRKAGCKKTPLVVLDHVGKVKPRDPKLSADRISGDITVEAKSCADETGSAWLALNQRNGFGDKRDNPRPIAADLYGGTGARADYDAVLYLYSAEKYKAERVKVAASDADWKKINRVFGSDIEGIRELGAIKVRFGDPTITETVKFEPRYARYGSNAPARPAELDF